MDRANLQEGMVNEDLAKLQQGMTKLWDKVSLISTQLQLSGLTTGVRVPAAAAGLGGDAKATVLKIPGDGNCAYLVMHAGIVKSRDAEAKLDLKPESRTLMSKMARKIVCLEASKEWTKDKEAFESLHGPFQTFMETILEEKRGSDTWPGFSHWRFYANASPGEVEYKIKQLVKDKDGTRVQTYSTKMEDEIQPKHVMFPVFRKGHFDIAAVGVDGEPCYVVPANRADAAEKLIDALLLKNPKTVHFAEDLDEKELGQLIDGALGLEADAPGEEDFTMVENRSNKKKKKKAEAEKKAAAAEKKATAQAEAAAEARMAKIAAKAATDAIRQQASGAATWAGAAAGQGWATGAQGWGGRAGALCAYTQTTH